MFQQFSPFTIAEDLLAMDPEKSTPHDLPGRYGRTVADLQRVLLATNTLSVVAGGWAVWHHGYAGRVTEDVDIVVGKEAIGALQQSAQLFRFDFLEPPRGRWPKLQHRETGIEVDLLPEGGIPGTPSNLAPVAIRAPIAYGASEDSLVYISLSGLVELKLGAGRAKDTADLIEILHLHPDRISELIEHVAQVHGSYRSKLQRLIEQSQDEHCP